MTTIDIRLQDIQPRATAFTASRDDSFRFARGVHVTGPSDIHQGYDLVEARKDYWVFTINVSAQNIGPTFDHLARHVRRPGYFILEVGTPQNVEATLRAGPGDPHHVDVYYLDAIAPRRAVSIFSRYESLLVHDGRTNFGFGSHQGVDEVYIGPYKVFRIFTDTPAKYVSALARLQFPRAEKIRTVWKTFTPRTPGRREALTDTPAVLETMLPSLQSCGLYFARRCEDPC